MRKFLLLIFTVLFFTACSYQDCHTVNMTDSDNITAKEAQSYYNTNCADKYTRASIDNRLPFVLGDAEWLWDEAQVSSYEDRSAIDIPLNGGYQYIVYRKQADGTYYSVRTLSRVVAVQNDKTGNISFYIRVSIPNEDNINTSTESLNFGDRINFSGLEYYITIDGCPAAIVRFENGEQTDGVFWGDETIADREKLYKFATLSYGLCIARCSGVTRNAPEMEYGKAGEHFIDQFGQWYVYIDLDGDGLGDAVRPIFSEDIDYTIHYGLSTGVDGGYNTTTGNGSGSNITGSVGTNSGGMGSGSSGGTGVGGGTNKDGQTPTNGDYSDETKDDSNSNKEDNFKDLSTNLTNPDGSISVNPTKNTNKKGYDIIKDKNITEPEPEENINLGDSNKFVAYKTNGQTNCLTLCKMILNNYGITNYGSPNNVFKLMYEVDGQLQHYGDNVQQNYQNAINCIDRHLEAGRPIIVGVNHSPNRNINEGTTDHFVVIYGRDYDSKTGYYYYFYYEVGKSDPEKGYNDSSNRFVYTPTEPPYFYDIESYRSHKERYDVIQVRPNDGNTEGTISQNK